MLSTGLVFVVPFLVAVSTAASTGPIVDLGYAKYQGVVNQTTGLTTFFNIKFAAAPTGTQRWRAPQPPQFTPGVQDATVMGPQCFNAGDGSALTSPFRNNVTKRGLERRAIASSEDCLVLNVWSPPNAKNLPVAVYIHGGGYMAGNADMTGQDLVHNAQNKVVSVLFQYRLGVFGFLPGSEVNKDGDLNVGILDQQFALQWIQQHITKFGGDPNEVTIWGESAGAGSVLQQIIANGGNTQPPLFKRAMTSSTFLPFQYKFSDPIPEMIFSEVAQSVGCSNATDIMACLRSDAVAAGALETANINIGQAAFFGEFQFVPVVDGKFIRESPIATISKGKLNGEVFLAITNTFEGAAFTPSAAQLTGTLAQYIANAIPTLPDADVQRAAQIYSTTPGLNTLSAQAIAVQGEVIFICPTYYLLEAFGPRGHKGEFAIPPGGHGMDVQFYFNSAGTVFNNAEFIASFSQAFSDIQVFGDVNKKVSTANKTPFWPAWSEGHAEMLFNVTADFTTPVIHTINTDPLLLQRCDFWKGLAAKSGQ